MKTAIDDFVRDQQGVESERSTEGWGLGNEKPNGPYTLVVALERHIYMERERKIDQRMLPGMHYWMLNDRVERNQNAGLVHPINHIKFDWWTAEGRVLGVEGGLLQPRSTKPSDGSIKIVQGCGYDPGSAVFRFHSAVNEHTKHSSVFIRWEDTNPYCSLRQYDAHRDATAVRQSVMEADVLHNHVAYYLQNNTKIQPQPHQLLVRHYHGSATGGRTNLEPIFDQAKQAVLFGARLQLCEEGKDKFQLEMHWSPIPVPVLRYRALRDRVRKERGWVPLEGVATKERPLVVAHTPTNSKIKGTDAYRAAIQKLQKRKVPIVADHIHGVKLGEAIERQALADVMFDSFWLGIQGSGLQAGAMQIPVVAGDPDNRVIYQRRIGQVPYTFANTEQELMEVLERMAMDPDFRTTEANRTAQYVQDYHDYAVVGAMYERSLSQVMGRPDILTQPRRVMPPLNP
jgi:hypothetical protein